MTIIDAAQKLQKQAFPALAGLQSVCCGLTMTSEFVQVISGREHCLKISTINTSRPDVHVYDSMCPTAGTLVKAQTAVLHTESPAIYLQFMNVQMQAEGYDCGLFAVETGIFISCFFSMCNTAQLIPIIYILSRSCSLCIDIILKLLTNLLAITMPY